jgi:hypothetical protein
MTGSYLQARDHGLTPEKPRTTLQDADNKCTESQNQQRTNNCGLDPGASEIDVYEAAATSSSAASTDHEPSSAVSFHSQAAYLATEHHTRLHHL